MAKKNRIFCTVYRPTGHRTKEDQVLGVSSDIGEGEQGGGRSLLGMLAIF